MVVNGNQQLSAARGVVRWPGEVSDLEDQIAALGRYCVLLEGIEVEDKATFLEVCEAAFELPEWFGRNWDALEECLLDLPSGRGADGTVVIWADWAVFAESDAEEYATALDVFEDTARALGSDGVPFAVLLVGDGPDDEDGPVDDEDGPVGDEEL